MKLNNDKMAQKNKIKALKSVKITQKNRIFVYTKTKKNMKTAVIGTRTFDNYQALCETLGNLANTPTEIISGGATGADALAERYAKDNHLPLVIFRANWEKHGKAAGPVRNKIIIENCDQLVAFWDGESKGTNHTIKIARTKGKPTKVLNYGQTQQTALFG